MWTHIKGSRDTFLIGTVLHICSQFTPPAVIKMVGLYYNNNNTLRLDHSGESKGRLLSKSFLDSKPPQEHLNCPSDLGKANNLAVGNIFYIHLALLTCNKLGTMPPITPSRKTVRGIARKAKRTRCFPRLPSYRCLHRTRPRLS